MASEVEIHLPLFQGTTTEWIHALTIPSEDIRRFTIRPLKWLRFATFTVCGARGHLSTSQGGEIVDYQNVTFDNLANKYFYMPNGEYHFTDFQAFSDRRSTSSAFTPRHVDFREKICRRDGACVVTALDPESCHASHIIPLSKGDNYFSFVLDDRSSLYGGLPPSLQEDVGANSIENGILLEPTLHGMFDSAKIAFLKTPNFAMTPADVPRIKPGPIPDNRTTLQYIKLPSSRYMTPQSDIITDWSPESILFDFMYGAAIAKYWSSAPLLVILKKNFDDVFRPVLGSHPATPSHDDGEEPDDDNSANRTWEPSCTEGNTFISIRSPDIMDYLLFLPAYLRGISAREVVAEWERKHKEAELRSEERSCDKVQQWLNAKPDQQRQDPDADCTTSM